MDISTIIKINSLINLNYSKSNTYNSRSNNIINKYNCNSPHNNRHNKFTNSSSKNIL